MASEHGTEMYMAPEQGEHDQYGRPADVFALGAVFTKMLLWGHDISPRSFKEYRKEQGPHQCKASKHYCYRHNLGVVQLALSQLSPDQKGVASIIDMVRMEMLEERHTLRPTSLDVWKRLFKYCTANCCPLAEGLPRGFQDASLKSMMAIFMGIGGRCRYMIFLLEMKWVLMFQTLRNLLGRNLSWQVLSKFPYS